MLFYPNIKWNSAQKFFLRLGVPFILLFIFPVPFSNELLSFFGKTLLGIPDQIDFEENGSGDKLMHYLGLLAWFAMAAIVALIWTIADRKRQSYDKLFHYFLILCRYYLAYVLIGYGVHKVLRMQMPDLSLNSLLQPIGDQTPMGIAWKFIGFSELYGKFSGWAEVIPGVLLLFRRTTLLGSCIAFTVMFNVMLLNYGYDIPVKIYSSFLVLLSLIILSPNFSRIIGFFRGTRVESADYPALFSKPVFKISRLVLKTSFILFLLWSEVYQGIEMANEYGEDAPKAPLYGIYQTREFIRNGDTIQLYTDSSAWKHMVFNWEGIVSVYRFSDKRWNLQCEVDTINKSINLKRDENSQEVSVFNYIRENDSIVTFSGTFKSDTLRIRTIRKDRNHFRLYKTGFNWINEYPNNR